MKSYKQNKREVKTSMAWRRWSVAFVFMSLTTALLAKTLDMQILRSEFFEKQGMHVS